MCGINGFNWCDVEKIKKMNEAIRHRGPDDEGIYVDDNVSLGHVRLSIIDLSVHGRQPMCNEDGNIWIVYNGEIYNFKELRYRLIELGHKFSSKTDTEVIIHAYEEWGFNCVEKFNGMWAFAIYDKSSNILFLSRDRFGKKPLYYYLKDGKFIFSSEIKGVLSHEIKVEQNDKIIFDYLFLDLLDHTEETFFKDIKRVMPGRNLIFNLKTRDIQISRYYDLKNRIKHEEYNSAKLRDLLFKAVKRRLVADVPVGSCLSGGLDSSSIVCIMRLINKYNSIKTFSLIFPGKDIDESKYQEIVVRNTSVEWYKTTFNFTDILEDIYNFIYTQEEPVQTLSMYGQYKVMELAEKYNMKVLLDGQGGDEILCGYYSGIAAYLYELIRNFKVIEFISELITLARKRIFMKVFPFILYYVLVNLNKNIVLFLIKRKKIKYLRKDFINEFIKKRSTIKKLPEIKSFLDYSIKWVTTYSLPQLLRFEDKSSMRFSIETRLPFCDYELVEYILGLSSNLKYNNGVTKYCLRDALKGILPNEIRNRTDKVGFITPDDELLRCEEGRRFVLSIINSKSFKSRKYWDWRKVKKMFEEHINGKDYSREIWKCILLEIWFRVWIDNKNSNDYRSNLGVNT